MKVLRVALTDSERGLGGQHLVVDDATIDLLAIQADGDARRRSPCSRPRRLWSAQAAPSPLRSSARRSPGGSPRTTSRAKSISTCSRRITSRCGAATRRRALYWMARMIEGGEDPMTLFRRAIAMAAEDIGLADPAALHARGRRSRRVPHAGAPGGVPAARRDDDLPGHGAEIELVVMALTRRWRPRKTRRRCRCRFTCGTRRPALMKALGYGKAYHYPHDDPDEFVDRSTCRRAQGRRVLSAGRPRVRAEDRGANGLVAASRPVMRRDFPERQDGSPHPGHDQRSRPRRSARCSSPLRAREVADARTAHEHLDELARLVDTAGARGRRPRSRSRSRHPTPPRSSVKARSRSCAALADDNAVRWSSSTRS